MVKLQVVFPDGVTEVPADLPVLHASRIGRIHTLIMRMSAQEAEDLLARYNPLLVDAVPLDAGGDSLFTSWEVRTMQSKTSCFNGTLFRKNLTRFWPLWGLASFIGAPVPPGDFAEFSRGDWSLTAPEFTRMYYQVVSVVPAIDLVYAALCALAVWSYLYSARSVGLMHTLPIRREGIFLTNFLSGFAMTLIPTRSPGPCASWCPCAAASLTPRGCSSRCWRCWVRASFTSPAPPSSASSPATPLPCRRCTPCSTSWQCCWTG